MKEQVKQQLTALYESWERDTVTRVEVFPPSGSNRKYCRLYGKNKTVIGVYNEDYKENKAFIEFSRHFRNQGMKVPKIYTEDLKNSLYLIEDFGSQTLFEHLTRLRVDGAFSDELIELYQKILTELIRFQTLAGRDLDYSYCYPRARFDKQSMMWDLHYFKYYFLKLAQIPFDEQLLEDDFQRFSDYLLEANCNFFMYRDFQSRNIMLKEKEPLFIDYQGGRKGALQYDLASLLYDAKADVPEDVRELLLDFYIEEVQKQVELDKEKFRTQYYGYVLVRIMQAMGAYGFRGFYEKKEHFLKSIPYAMENLKVVLAKLNLPFELPQLTQALQSVSESERLLKIAQDAQAKLRIEINSFSYKRGIPIDLSENGGGYVFDCRAIHNPGRYEQYRALTGKDPEVIQFLESEDEMETFLSSTLALIDFHVKRYQQRNFTNLQINYGCTGGQHRSVYAAERTAKYLKEHFDVKVSLRHREREFAEKK